MAEIKGRSAPPNKSRTPSRTGLSRVTQQQANERPPFAEQEFPEQILAKVDEAESPTRGFSVLLIVPGLCFLRIGLCSGLFGLLIEGVGLIFYDQVFSCLPGFRTQGS